MKGPHTPDGRTSRPQHPSAAPGDERDQVRDPDRPRRTHEASSGPDARPDTSTGATTRRLFLAGVLAAGVSGVVAAGSDSEDDEGDESRPARRPIVWDWGKADDCDDDDGSDGDDPDAGEAGGDGDGDGDEGVGEEEGDDAEGGDGNGDDEGDADDESDDEGRAPTTIVVDPVRGVDTAAGTAAGPLSSLGAAVGRARPGDTILLRAGTDRIDDSVDVDVDDLTITVARGVTFTLDARGYDPAARGDPYGSGGALTLANTTGVTIDGSPGRIEVRNSGWTGLLVRGSREFLVRGVTVANCAQSGVHVAAGSADGRFEWCASVGNFGPRAGQNWGDVVGGAADGFSAAAGRDDPRSAWPRRLTFSHCLAHHNSDDGWDLIRAEDCLIERCISYWNGYSLTGRPASEAPGTGFKLGYGRSYYGRGGDPPKNNRLRESIAYGNGAWGVSFGGGTGHVVDRVTTFDCNRKRGSTPIGYWDAESGSVTRCLATGIEERSAVDRRDNVVLPLFEWGMDVSRDGRGHATRLGTFCVPTDDSPFAGRDVGALGPTDTWARDVMRMRKRPTLVVF